MKITIKKNYNCMSKACAISIAGYIIENPGRLICFAAGDTPLGVLRELVKMYEEEVIDLSSMSYVSLDEWVGLNKEDKGSCAQVMLDNFYTPANIPKERLCLFDGKNDPEEETNNVFKFIDSHGGIGLTLLGVGMNGHVGFNEPGTPPDFAGGLVKLSEISSDVGKKYFDVPYVLEYGITIGLKYLTGAEKAFIIANGQKKAEIIARYISAKSAVNDIELPVSHFNGENVHVFLDESSAQLGMRMRNGYES